ncbi:Six-hairpin glycosidase-like protein [Xylariales sp. AK1849]|nr:Six-hairpin glycosidase-like protein [Xylariales sp. AK1849]
MHLMRAVAVAALTFHHPAAADNVTYAKWMASSIISRGQGILTGGAGVSELLQTGFTQKAFTALLAQYPNSPEVREYIRVSAVSVAPVVSNASYDALSYPMDRLSNGQALLALSGSPNGLGNATKVATLRAGLDALRESIDLNRRNDEGGLWYYTYPEWSYLDGTYSLAPFYTLYSLTVPVAKTANSTTVFGALDDMLHQLTLLWSHTRNSTSGLLVHGYDASLTAVWADPVTGASPHVWGRSLGWIFMALVDTLETIPSAKCYAKYSTQILSMFQDLAAAVVDAVDAETGGWWQVLDQQGREGNYIESSGSAMFAYGLLKGVRLGYLEDDGATTTEVAYRGWQYLTSEFVIDNGNGTLGYNGTVSVCSLNSSASYEYYIGQPINYNSVLGSAAYVLASLEVERLRNT